MAFSLIGVIVFALVVPVVLAPVFHRVLHTFHGLLIDEPRAPVGKAQD
jgi:hypothetical protein